MKRIIGFLICFNIPLSALQDHPIFEGFDDSALDFFSFEAFSELKQKEPLAKVAILTTDDGSGKWVKTFCSAQGFATYALTKNPPINPINKQVLLGLAVATYQKAENKFTGVKYYDKNNIFNYIYENLSTSGLPNSLILLFSKACLDVSHQTREAFLRASYRNAAQMHLKQLLDQKERTPIEEQDACALLTELHMCNTPNIIKDFKAVKNYALRILDLQESITKYKTESPEDYQRAIINPRQVPVFAMLMLGKVTATGGYGVDKDLNRAVKYFDNVINSAYQDTYYINQALLSRAEIFYYQHNELSLPRFSVSNIKALREFKVQRDLVRLLNNNPTSQQKAAAEEILSHIVRPKN